MGKLLSTGMVFEKLRLSSTPEVINAVMEHYCMLLVLLLECALRHKWSEATKLEDIWIQLFTVRVNISEFTFSYLVISGLVP